MIKFCCDVCQDESVWQTVRGSYSEVQDFLPEGWSAMVARAGLGEWKIKCPKH